MGKETIRELRERLQGPRRPYDTYYGRYVMRRFSIYLTVLCSKMSLGPSTVTLLSILAGLLGAFLIYKSHWLTGILLVNAWYLLDHVDGEIARYQGVSSPTGLYFDTIANSIVPFFTFLAMGFWLSSGFAKPHWFLVGLASAYGSLMLLLLAYCENTVLFQWLGQGKSSPPSIGEVTGGISVLPASLPKRIFSATHFFVAFPVFLPLASVLVIVFSFFDESLFTAALKLFLASYSILVSVVWLTILCHRVLSRKLDQMVRSLSK